MTVEFFGVIQHRRASEMKSPPVIFDRVLVGYSSDGPDGSYLGAAVAQHTSRLGFVLAHPDQASLRRPWPRGNWRHWIG